MIRIGLAVLCLLAVVGVLILVLAGTPSTTGNTRSPSSIQTIGIPEHGIGIVGHTDALFSTLMSDHFQTTNGFDVARLKSSSVFVVNESAQPIAALKLKWSLLQPDGRTIVHFRGFSSNLNVISDGESVSLSEALALGGHRLVSLVQAYNISNTRFRSNIGGGRTNALSQLSESLNVMISVDGVLFADGTFVGPDTRGFFGMLKEEIEARREVFEEAARALSGDSHSMTRIERLANGNLGAKQIEDDDLRLPAAAARSYPQFVKQRFAAGILAGRKMLDDKTALERINAELNKPRISLHKL